MVLGISEFDVEDTLDSMLSDIEQPKVSKVEVDNLGQTASDKLVISNIRIFFSRLTDEQIRHINETSELPENAKFVSSLWGNYRIVNNWLNFRVGTQVLPFGYEVKKNILGQVVVVPIGSKGIWIK